MVCVLPINVDFYYVDIMVQDGFEPGRKPLSVVQIKPPWWYFVDNMEMCDFNTTLRTTK